MTSLLQYDEDLLYPSEDGQPMAESTEQYRWIVMVKENLEILFKDNPAVFIAGDLLWYPEPVEVPPAPCQAPDVMVALGRPKGMRLSYKQWEEGNVAPQVVFEILSRSNRTRRGREAMALKFRFYEVYGVQEYYIYDPDKFTLQGWQRQGDALEPIPQMSDWVSPRLGIQFVWQPRQTLILYSPEGQRFLSSIELAEQAEQAQQEAQGAQQKAQQAQQEAQQAQQEAQQAQQEAQQAQQQVELAQQEAQQAQQKAEQAQRAVLNAVPRLQAMGLSPEQIADSLGLAIAAVETCLAGLDLPPSK
jgi:Uma2 family endonuclease